jgi:hypothetical protein
LEKVLLERLHWLVKGVTAGPAVLTEQSETQYLTVAHMVVVAVLMTMIM